jgi:perosamine synthetase
LASNWISTSGKYVSEFEKKISSYTGAKFTIACNSGTAALQVALRIAGVEQKDEVIVPTLTFVATINSIIYNQATPIFMDCDDYYNLDIDKTIEFLKNKTILKKGYCINKRSKKKIKAILPVYVWGNAVKLKKLKTIAKKKNIKIIEDASEALGTFLNIGKKKKHAGLQGLAGCLSFNANKIITTGGGGAIITNNARFAKKALYLTTQAKSKSLNFIHNDVGYNYRLTSLPATLGLAQIQKIKPIIRIKTNNYNYYKKKMNELDNFRIAEVPTGAMNNHWMNILQIDTKKKVSKNLLIKEFIKKGIQARPVWKLNHKQVPFKSFEKYKILKANELYKRSICLPSGATLNKKKINFIIKTLKKINHRII